MSVQDRDRDSVQCGALQTRLDGWPQVTLAEAPLEIIDGDRGKNYPKQHEFLGSGHCLFLNAGNVTTDGFSFTSCSFISSDRDQRLGKGKATLHDIVLTTRGTIGNTAYFNENIPYQHIRINSGMVILRPSHWELDPRFLYLVTRSPQFHSQIQSLSTGSAQPQLPIRDIRQINIPFPPLSAQRAIAHVLGTLDDKIELNRRMNETLEEMARALFKSWFVDFDPVRAKAALKQHALGHNTVPDGEPSANGAPAGEWTVDRARSYLDAMDPQIADLFPDRLVDSEFGEIPEGWEVTALGELADLNSESWSRVKTPHAVEYVDLARTKWGLIEATQNFLWKDAPSRARRILRPGDTIVGTVRPGNGSYSFIGRDGLTGSTGFAVLRPRNRQFRELVYFAATAAENIERLAHRADGAAYPAVRPEVVADTKVAVPAVPDDEVLWFSVVVGPMLDRLESNKTEMHSLAAQRDALLPKLLAGQTPMPV